VNFRHFVTASTSVIEDTYMKNTNALGRIYSFISLKKNYFILRMKLKIKWLLSGFPVYVLLMGGLGNQLFTFSSAYAYARTKNRPLVVIKSWFNGKQRGRRFESFRRTYELEKFPKFKSKFTATESIFATVAVKILTSRIKYFAKYFGVYVEANPLYDANLFKRSFTVISGYLQSEKYFQMYRHDLLEIFSLNGEEMESLKVRMGYSSQRSNVCLHIRREDTLVLGNGWTGLLTEEYYGKILEEIDRSNSTVYVFSDSPDWCRSRTNFQNCIIVEEPDPVVTLQMMSLCDFFIIAGSTLSWWGAWLSNAPDKVICAPYPFFKERDVQLERDLIPENWIRKSARFE